MEIIKPRSQEKRGRIPDLDTHPRDQRTSFEERSFEERSSLLTFVYLIISDDYLVREYAHREEDLLNFILM